MKIGKKIRALRRRNNYSQSSLATKIGVTQRQISHWENNTRKVTFEHIIKIARVLKKDIHYFCTTNY